MRSRCKLVCFYPRHNPRLLRTPRNLCLVDTPVCLHLSAHKTLLPQCRNPRICSRHSKAMHCSCNHHPLHIQRMPQLPNKRAYRQHTPIPPLLGKPHIGQQRRTVCSPPSILHSLCRSQQRLLHPAVLHLSAAPHPRRRVVRQPLGQLPRPKSRAPRTCSLLNRIPSARTRHLLNTSMLDLCMPQTKRGTQSSTTHELLILASFQKVPAT
jgi:hypothetical protein